MRVEVDERLRKVTLTSFKRYTVNHPIHNAIKAQRFPLFPVCPPEGFLERILKLIFFFVRPSLEGGLLLL